MSRSSIKHKNDNSSKAKNDALQKLDNLAFKTKEAKKNEITPFKKSHTKIYASLAIAIVVIGSLGAYALFAGPSGSIIPPPSSEYPDYTVCTGTTITTHYHFHLFIYLNGVQDPIPADMGITNNGACVRPIHTHDATGEIHVEMPSSITRHPTLSDVFTVYRITNSKATLLKNELMSLQGTVTCTVNGQSVSDFVGYTPADGDTVNLSVQS